MKRKEENRSVIEPSCTFFKPNKINFLPSNRVLDRKPDRVTGYKVLIDLTSLVLTHLENVSNNFKHPVKSLLWIINYICVVQLTCATGIKGN
jgi:hypothetical protein